MSVANNIYIRTIAPTGTSRSATTATDDAHANMNSLGTAVIMDGAALSNNANMQLLSATMQGENANVGVGATPAAGVDLRGISTDNIESVEVIRGIPSAQYGDLTSGAVIIKTKAGDGGKIFGSITSKDIADALKDQHKITVDKKKIQLANPVKMLGEMDVAIKLYPEVSTTLNVKIIAG
jgi:hypothetical protein